MTKVNYRGGRPMKKEKRGQCDMRHAAENFQYGGILVTIKERSCGWMQGQSFVKGAFSFPKIYDYTISRHPRHRSYEQNAMLTVPRQSIRKNPCPASFAGDQTYEAFRHYQGEQYTVEVCSHQTAPIPDSDISK